MLNMIGEFKLVVLPYTEILFYLHSLQDIGNSIYILHYIWFTFNRFTHLHDLTLIYVKSKLPYP